MGNLVLTGRYMERKRLNIGLDIDGCIGNFMGAARELLKEMYNGRPSDDMIQTGWGLDSLGINKEEERAFWKKLDEIPNWWLNQKVMPGTSRLWDAVHNHRVIFITNRKEGTGWPIDIQTQEWLCRNFHLHRPNVIISDNKGPLMDALKLDYFLDDRPKNVEEAANASTHCQTALYDATYNQDFKYGWRVKSLDDFLNQIDPMREGDTIYNIIEHNVTIPRCIQ